MTHCGNQTSGFRQIHPSNITRANPIMSPTNPDLIAYFSNGNICVHDVTTNSDAKLTDLTDDDGKFLGFMLSSIAKKFFWENVPQRDHPFKTSACLSGGKGYPHVLMVKRSQYIRTGQDQKSPS